MHNWGDNDVDWAGIDNAADYIEKYCIRWGRFGGQAKEKYGTVRFYVSFHNMLYELFWTSHHYARWTHASYWPRSIRWLSHLIGPALSWFDDKIYSHRYNFLILIIQKWQHKVYRNAYKNALKRWPHLRDEILCCADYPDLLEGL